MIGHNRAAHFKGHVSEVSSWQRLQQPFLQDCDTMVTQRVRKLGCTVVPLPLNQFFRLRSRCPFPAYGQLKPVAIRRKSRGGLFFLHPKLCEIVPMKPVSFLRLACQHTTHSLLYVLGQRPTEVRINTSHYRDGVTTDLNIAYIANPMRC